jgi:hypothetical protein
MPLLDISTLANRHELSLFEGLDRAQPRRHLARRGFPPRSNKKASRSSKGSTALNREGPSFVGVLTWEFSTTLHFIAGSRPR